MYWFELVQSSEPLISSMISLIMTQSTDTAFNSYFHVSTPYSLDFINVLINLLSMQVRNVKVCQEWLKPLICWLMTFRSSFYECEKLYL